MIAILTDTGMLGDPGGEVIDARGRTVLPGFIDAHVHPGFGGLHKLRVWLNDASSKDEYLQIISAAPGTGWVTGGGWHMTIFPGGTPRKEDLDAIWPDRPVFLLNRDVHGAWVNSKALELAGIKATSPDPPHGRVERDPDGEPTGTLHEGAAYWVNDHVVPKPKQQDWEQAILVGQQYLHSVGITGWQDAWVTPALQQAYIGLAESGRLTGRVVGALWWERHRGLEQIDELVARRKQAATGFHPTTVKIMLDGVLENYTGALLEPYCGCGEQRGLNYIDPDLLNEAVTRLDGLGFQVHMHAIGDRAVRMGLDAVEAGGSARNRHHIAHLQVVHPDDVARFGQLSVTANCQMLWASYDEQMRTLAMPLLGERVAWQYPFASLARVTRLAAGSDWPVSSANPLEQIQVGLTRQGIHDRREPLLPHERLDRASAFAAFTTGSAWLNRDPDPGYVILGANLDDVADHELSQVPIDVTISGGRVVFER